MIVHSPSPQPLAPARAKLSPRGKDNSRDPFRHHRGLLDPVLPLMSASWQRARLSLGEAGVFAQPPGCAPDERIEVDLELCAQPAIARRGAARFTLAYDPADAAPAQAALIACASQGGSRAPGWPIACDEASLALLTLAERIALADIPVLLEGPTGTGKEVLARFIHRRSARAEGPLVAVNCAAMPEAMLEGLLFGHRKGAFTGAAEAREGLFRAADGGTLLLDEIGELPLSLQAKLLRALQEGEVLPLGSTSPVNVDVRIIAATNRDLACEVAEGRFREDLLYRLNVFPLRIPALRDRPEDIAPLAFGMLLRHACQPLLASRGGAASAPAAPGWITSAALEMLEAHAWPGNVRELENVIRRAILLAGDAPAIEPSHIVFDRPVREVAPQAEQCGETSLSAISFQSEARAILTALDENNGHRARTASALGISQRTLRYRLASMRESGLIAAEHKS